MGDSAGDRKCELLKEFGKLAKENGVERLDDEYLIRFLVGRQYDVFAALHAVRCFESFVNRRKSRWLSLQRRSLQDIFEAHIVDVLDRSGIQEQKIVWIRVEKWNPQSFSADEILEVSGLLCELAYAETKEIKHIDVIVDLNNFSLKHLYGLSPKFAKRMVYFMSECLPMKILHIYVVRQPKMFYLVYSLFKPFIEERMRKMVTVCGHNYEYLLANVGSEILPKELGGRADTSNPSRWIQVMNSRKVLKDLKISGYYFY